MVEIQENELGNFNEAKKEQEKLSELVGKHKWTLFRKHEHYLLKLKLALLLFGTSSKQIDDDESLLVMMFEDGYFTPEQCALMEDLYQLILGEVEAGSEERLEVGFFFLSLLLSDGVKSVPMIRVRLPSSNQIRFIDHSKRVYQSWEDFQDWDYLPKCKYVYPLDGWYRRERGELELGVAESRKARTPGKVASGFDIASGVTGGISAGCGIAGAITLAFFPPASIPLLITSAVSGGLSSGYGISRSIYTLSDRGNHKQTLSPADSEARAAWIGVGASALGLVACGVATLGAVQVARAGTGLLSTGSAVASTEVRVVQAISGFTNLTSHVTNIVDIIITAIQKGEFNHELLTKIMYYVFCCSHLLISRNTLKSIGSSLTTAEIPRVSHFIGSKMANFLYNLGDTLRSLIERNRLSSGGKVDDIYVNLRRGYTVEREEAGKLAKLERKKKVFPYHLDMFWQFLGKSLDWPSEDLRKAMEVCDAIALSILMGLSRRVDTKEVDALSLLFLAYLGLKKRGGLSEASCLEGVDGSRVAEGVVEELLGGSLEAPGEELVPSKYWLKVKSGHSLKVDKFSEFLFSDPLLLPRFLQSDSPAPLNWSTVVRVNRFPSHSFTLYEITFLPRVNLVLEFISKQTKTPSSKLGKVVSSILDTFSPSRITAHWKGVPSGRINAPLDFD